MDISNQLQYVYAGSIDSANLPQPNDGIFYSILFFIEGYKISEDTIFISNIRVEIRPDSTEGNPVWGTSEISPAKQKEVLNLLSPENFTLPNGVEIGGQVSEEEIKLWNGDLNGDVSAIDTYRVFKIFGETVPELIAEV